MKKLLIADDDCLIVNQLAEGLRDLGYAAASAVCGEDAVQLARQDTFDLAVLGLRLPGMPGLEVARTLKKAGGPPFVFLTASRDAGEFSPDLGALGYLLKPIDVLQLVPFIEASMERGREIVSLRGTAVHFEGALRIERRTRAAVGLIMERTGLERQAAFDLLRNNAHVQRRRIGELAEDIIAAAEGVSPGFRPPT